MTGRGELFISPQGHSYESLFYLIASVTLALLGPGAYSIDGFFLEKSARQGFVFASPAARITTKV